MLQRLIPPYRITRRLVAKVLLGLALFLANASHGAEPAYVHTLQKVSPTKSILIVDLAKERKEGAAPATQYDALEAYLAIISIQGIVNRDSERKIFLINGPSGFAAHGGLWQAPPLDQWALEEGMLPVPQAQATLDVAKRWPALSYLAHAYRSQLKGIVRIPHVTWQSRSAIFDSQLAAAVTAVGQTDSILASPAIEAYLRDEGITLDTLADVTKLTGPIDAYLWTRKHYFNEKTNRSAVAQLSAVTDATFDNSCDYYIATRTFCTACDSYGYSYYFNNLLKEYPPATCIMTKGENAAEIRATERAGHFMCIQTGANLSVHSGFPSDAAHFPPVPPPAPLPIDPNGVYVAFYVTDGDSAFQSNWSHWVLQRQSAQFGKVPVAWSFTPTLVDLFPNLVARRGAQERALPTTFEVVADMHDGHMPGTPEGEAAYGRMYREKLRVTNGIFTTVNSFVSHYASILQDMDAMLVIHSYSGAANGNAEPWFTMNEGHTLCTFPTGCTQDGCNPEEMYRALHAVVDRAPTGTPVFAVVIAGSGMAFSQDPKRSNDACAWAQAVLERCKVEGRPDRTYYPVLPRQLTATWRERHNLALGRPSLGSAGMATSLQAVDGLEQTAWSAPAGEQWYEVDLRAISVFDEVDINWQSAPKDGCRLLISDDGVTWKGVAAHTDECPLPATRARYVRVAFTGPAALAELRVVQIDRKDLKDALNIYTTVLKKAVVGNAPGQYTQTAVDTFAVVLRDARAVLDTPVVTQRVLERATEQAGKAYRVFWGAQNYNMQPLREALKYAEELATLAKFHIGTGTEAFPPDAVAVLTETVRQATAQAADTLPLQRGEALLDKVRDAEQYLLTSSPNPTPPDSTANLAYHRPVRCGDTSAGFKPESMVDGTLSTLWKSAQDKQSNWVTIDLGERHTISTVRLKWGDTFAREYSMELSDDGAAWRTVHTMTTGGGNTEIVLLAPVPARFIRINLTAWGWGGNYQLREIIIN